MNSLKFNPEKWRKKLNQLIEKTPIEDSFIAIFQELLQTLDNFQLEGKDCLATEQYLDQLLQQLEQTTSFLPYHRLIESNYQLGLDFFSPFVKEAGSKVQGLEQVDLIEQLVHNKENVILFSNHQTEPDPQLIDIALRLEGKDLAKKIIFVAGERVVIDPFTIPLSLGRNLICIYSKKHIDHPKEKRVQKLEHNQKTMQELMRLLNEGGKIVWLAPSGGRDRPNSQGNFEVAPFDPASIAMFVLLGKKAKANTHFFPLSLKTHPILPPPNTLKKELGEMRHLQKASVKLHFGPEIDLLALEKQAPGSSKEKREYIARRICEIVKKNYANL